MKRLKLDTVPKLISQEVIEEGNDKYHRLVYDTGLIRWVPKSYDGDEEDQDGELEKIYQKTFNNEEKEKITG